MSVKNWYPRGLSSAVQSLGMSKLCPQRVYGPSAWEKVRDIESEDDSPRIEELVSEHEVLSVAKAPQRLPRRLEPALLDKVRVQCEPPFLVQTAVFDPFPRRHLLDHFSDPFDLPRLQRRVKHQPLEIVQFVGREEAVLVGVDEAKDAREGGDAGRFQDVLARVVQGCGRVQDGVLGKEEDFRDVERQEGRTLDAGLRAEWSICGCGNPRGSTKGVSTGNGFLTSTSLNSCMIGTISVRSRRGKDPLPRTAQTRQLKSLTIFESLVGDLALAEVDLVPDQDDGDVDAEGTDRREPVSRDAVERVGVVDRVYAGRDGVNLIGCMG